MEDNLAEDLFLHDYATELNYDPVDLDYDEGDVPPPGGGYMTVISNFVLRLYLY